MTSINATDLGWRLGKSTVPSGVEVWVPYDRTAGVYGPQGSGKTLDLLTPALLGCSGGCARHSHQARRPLPHSRGAGGRRAARPRPRPVRPGAWGSGLGVGSRRRVCRLDDG